MSFAENLKKIRKEKGLSQEELAEIMGVSRQSVSKWEQNLGYPEVEKLLLLSNKLNISLDSLMSTEITQKSNLENKTITGEIVISSSNENVIVKCYKVIASGKMKGGKNHPLYALFGASNGISSFWGESTTFLGWYTNHELLSKEISEIQCAIVHGDVSYKLKYNVDTERKWGRIKIKEKK